METISRQELLLCTLGRQFLLEKGTKQEVVSALQGLQAQFATNPATALRIRTADFSQASWTQGLIKIWSHRGTIHVVGQGEVGLFLSARGQRQPWTDAPWGLSAKEKVHWAMFIRQQIELGTTQREALKQVCRQAGMGQPLVEKVFYGWGGLIKEMCDRGWIAYQSGTEKSFVLPQVEWMETEQARHILLERYFQTYGPATWADCAWFTGWKMAEIRRLATDLPLAAVECQGKVYYYLGELEAKGKLPTCLFLAGFDQLVLGYRDRSRCLEQRDLRNVTNQAGIVYPTILLRGRLRARWRKEPGRLIVTPFRSLSARDQAAIRAKGRKLFSGEPVEVYFQPPLADADS